MRGSVLPLNSVLDSAVRHWHCESLRGCTEVDSSTESDDASCGRRRTASVADSTGSRCAGDRRCRSAHAADLSADAPWAWRDIGNCPKVGMSHFVGMASVPRHARGLGALLGHRQHVAAQHPGGRSSRPRMPAGVGADRSAGCPPAGIVSLAPRSSSPGTVAPISWRPKRFPRTARPHTHGYGDCSACGQTRREGHAEEHHYRAPTQQQQRGFCARGCTMTTCQVMEGRIPRRDPDPASDPRHQHDVAP